MMHLQTVSERKGHQGDLWGKRVQSAGSGETVASCPCRPKEEEGAMKVSLGIYH